MPATPFRLERMAEAPFIHPYLPMPGGVQVETLRPGQLTNQAQRLLVERLGPADQSAEAAFAHGAAGLLTNHTRYFDGFALLMSLHQGTAVAVRRTQAPHSALTFAGSDACWLFDATTVHDDDTTPVWVCLVLETVRALGTDGAQVEVAVFSTVPAECAEAYVSALGIATARATQALFALPHSTAALIEAISNVIDTCLGWSIPVAHLLTAEAGQPTRFTLVDTATREWLPLDAPAPTQVGWGLVDVGGARLAGASIHTERQQQAQKALALLRKRGFDQITSFRDLEHRDLHRALKAVPRRLKPVVRHLVTENRRVQRLVFATRHKDWQMFGALLLMSHASLRDDWKRTDDAVDFVVAQVEAMTLDGMYGARVTGQGGCVLVVGQPYVIPLCLEQIKTRFSERFERTPATLLL